VKQVVCKDCGDIGWESEDETYAVPNLCPSCFDRRIHEADEKWRKSDHKPETMRAILQNAGFTDLWIHKMFESAKRLAETRRSNGYS